MTMAQKKGFLDLNVREVFEGNTVEGVQDIQKKIHYEIERKKEELRVLVGESYRDLIDAADTIAVMKDSSNTVVEGIKRFRTDVQGMPSNLGSAGGLMKASRQAPFTTTELEVAAEIKVALEAPRQVKSLLFQGRLVEAFHLYLLTKQLRNQEKPYRITSLHRLEWLYSSRRQGVFDPTVTMREAIVKYVSAMFQSVGTAAEKLAEAMSVYQVLSEESSEAAVRKFLEDQLSNSTTALEKDAADLSSAISFVLQSVYSIFIEPQLYTSASNAVKKPMVGLKCVGLQFLPKFLERFQNEMIHVDEAPRVSKLAEIIISGYLVPLRQLLNMSYDSGIYLSSFNSLDELERYRKSIVNVFKRDCEDVSRIVLGTTKSLWSEYFLEVFHRKCKVVIANSVDIIISYLKDEGFPKYQQLEDEFDLVNFVWTAQTFAEDKAYSVVNDELQWKGISPHVAELCKELNNHCQTLLQDSSTVSDSTLNEYISNHFGERFEKFLVSLINDEASSTILLGRWCVAVGELCPIFWKILKQNEIVQLRQRLSEIGEACFSKWNNRVNNHFNSRLRNLLPDLTISHISRTMPITEEFVSEEEGALKPSVRIPVQLSHGLQVEMFAACEELCRLGPQSVPKNVRDNFRFFLGKSVAEFYGAFNTKDLTSQLALQFIFDLKYIQWFHPNLSPHVDPVVKKLETVVDPFDLDIVYPKLKGNIKRCLFENHLTLGLLFSEESHGFVAQNFKTKGNKSFPSFTSGASGSLPLLPV